MIFLGSLYWERFTRKNANSVTLNACTFFRNVPCAKTIVPTSNGFVRDAGLGGFTGCLEETMVPDQ